MCAIYNIFRVIAFRAKLGRRMKIERRSIDRKFLDNIVATFKRNYEINGVNGNQSWFPTKSVESTVMGIWNISTLTAFGRAPKLNQYFWQRYDSL